MTLTIEATDLAIDEQAGIVRYDPESRRMKAEYLHYEFDRAEYERVVGEGALQKNVTLQVRIIEEREEQRRLADPSLPQPEGGFREVTYRCQVIGVVPQ